jgi:uncharacterized protein YceK
MRYPVQEPPKRRLHIKNRTRFIIFMLIVVSAIIVLSIPKEGHSNVEYKPYRVGYGDTYWGIAKELQEAGYRSRADIREVVHELVKMSGIPAHELKEGDIISVPNIE